MTGRDAVWDAHRRWGYLQADLDPLGRLPPSPAALPATGPDAPEARRAWCGTLSAECMHLPDDERREWVVRRMEAADPVVRRDRILERLARAEILEQVVQRRYVGTKRFSIEGAAALLPLVGAIADELAADGAEEIVLGSAHRGRLNLIVNFAGLPAREVFAQFEDVHPSSVLGGGDVVYHLGATGRHRAADGRELVVRLVSNPSHLEAVGPVVLGRSRGEQDRLHDGGRARVVPVTVHGDAAFAGQGIAAETLNLSALEGYSAGGTIHIVVNNLIGFTTEPASLHSSPFATDVARRLPVPVLHVNSEDPDAVARAGRMAADFRAAFNADVVVDLIGYRRWGHSEIDDPSVTLPALYARIRARGPVWESYASRVEMPEGDRRSLRERLEREFSDAADEARRLRHRPSLIRRPEMWAGFVGGPSSPEHEVETAVDRESLIGILEDVTTLPRGFAAHEKVRAGMEHRRRMMQGGTPVDWAAAEALAFASLAREGTPVRLSGEDSRRGTFNQRHAALVDVDSGAIHVPLSAVRGLRAPIEIWDSPLSEAAVLGFEYGYSRSRPDVLVLWEAQFGDFANGAQTILDQFVAAGEDKWGLLSGLVMLLPHGYEGQGPEHSSARLERFLQLAAEDNLQIAQPTTAAQFFHLLRRQARRRWRKPLVVLTPKSLLRRPEAASPLEDFSSGRFHPVLGDPAGGEALLLGTGKIVHELRRERERRGASDTPILSLEQLVPFPERELAEELGRHPEARRLVWVQEEPGNMGARSFVLPRLRRMSGGRPVLAANRSPSASPATGSRKAHELEQSALLGLAFATANGGEERATLPRRQGTPGAAAPPRRTNGGL